MIEILKTIGIVGSIFSKASLVKLKDNEDHDSRLV